MASLGYYIDALRVIDLILFQNRGSEDWRRFIEPSSKLRLITEPQSVEADFIDTLHRFPDASVVMRTGPSDGERLVRHLARIERKALIDAPISPAALLRIPASAELQVVNGWTSMPGRLWLERILETMQPHRARFDIRGVPSGDDCELEEVIEQAAGFIARAFPPCFLREVEQRQAGNAVVRLATASGTKIELCLSDRGQRFKAEVEGFSWKARFELDDSVETLCIERGDERKQGLRRIPSPPERALAQLLDPALGHSLAQSRAGWELAARIIDRLSFPSGITRQALSLSASIELRSGMSLESLGLRGQLEPKTPGRVVIVPNPLPEIPLELLGVVANIKPVAFLTVSPSEVDSVLKIATGLAVERRDRRVHIEASQDAWDDRRDRGVCAVELYIARDPELALRTAKLQAEADPTASIQELGNLLGYPSCCIEAFAAQRDRSNNTQNRYASFARTRSKESFHYQLSNFWVTIAPFFPCRYDCPSALRYAEELLGALESRFPGTVANLADALAHPTLHFTHGVCLTLRGGRAMADGDRVRVRDYSSVGVFRNGPSFEHDLAAWLASGDQLELAPLHLKLWRKDEVIATLERVDPALGFIAPFTSEARPASLCLPP